MDNQTLIKRISLNPEQCGGQPCIRGLRVRVIDVLALVAVGLTVEEIIEELPDLEAVVKLMGQEANGFSLWGPMALAIGCRLPKRPPKSTTRLSKRF
jgi:uncharacterized protein (DUF433 family)